MNAPVVTLFEKYGSGARYIGPLVADALGVRWLDQAISSAEIEEARYPGSGGASDEGGALSRFLGQFAASAALLDDASIPLAQAQDADLVRENTRTVKTVADTGGVLLGRNGALILGGVPGALHVLLDAPLRVRIARAAKMDGIDETLAAKRQKNEDRIRAELSERLYHWNPMDIDKYDLVVNTGAVDLDTAADVIVAAYRAKSARVLGAVS
jgi:cytidylate kinase